MSTRSRRAAAAMCLLLVAGCGLPLGGGVRQPGQVPDEQRQGGDIQVLPPGPRDDAPPVDIVRDFYGAQSSPDDAHASAREFLAPESRRAWRDDAPVGVLAAPLDIEPLTVTSQSATFHVTGAVNAEIASDGAFIAGRRPVDLLVTLRRGPRGRWLIAHVPNGLLISAADRERSFRARNMYFLAPPSAPGAAASHLVPDQVFLPVTRDTPDGLVRRLLDGPSRLLGDSVTTAFPRGTTLRTKTTINASGLVTVDLSTQAGRASGQQREQMSAQLVWTLHGNPDFSRLQLLSGGKPLAAGGNGQAVVRDRSDWQPYDPDGLPSRPTLYYISGRRLRVLEPATPSANDRSQREVVDLAAASPRGGGLALITRGRGGAELSTGPATGPFVVRARAASLSFPSWGSGEQGIWFLRNGRIMLATLTGPPVDVPVDGLTGFGPLTGMRVSRDGARVGVVAGVGEARRLLVGRVAERRGRLRIVDVRSVAPGVRDVRDLTWDSATSLVVLGVTATAAVAVPIRVAVDGSSVALVNRVGLEGSQPLTIAAAPGQPLVVGARFAGVLSLFTASSVTPQYVRERGITGAEPFYAG